MDQQTQENQSTRSFNWLAILCILVICFGTALRLTHLGTKIFWGDEVYTAMRVSGYTQADLAALYDGHVHTIAEVARFQHLDSQHSLSDTVHSLVVDDPQHPPLFYLAERIWAGVVGDSPAQLRLLAALLSLAIFPAIFILCRELFADVRVGWIAMALVAVSPFHMIYAHEAREYSLWAVTTLLCTAALLRALRLQTVASWGFYAASLTLTLYSDLLSVYVIAAHGLWSFGQVYRSRDALLKFAFALAVGIGGFALWMLRIWSHWTTFTSYMSWGNFRYPLSSMLQKWVFNTGAVLFDLEYLQLRLFPIALIGIILLFAAVITTARYAPRRSSSLLAALGGIITLAIVVQDFRTGTYFSTIARYFTPLWLSLEIALAYSFVTWQNNPRRSISRIATFGLICCLVAGAISSSINSSAQAWWNNHINASCRQVAAVVNAENAPLLISAYRPDALLVLSHELRPDVHILLVVDRLPKKLPQGFGQYDLLSPTPEMANAVTLNGQFKLGQRQDFLESGSPIEQFHANLRRGQSQAHLRERQTPQEFLLHLQS